MSDLGRVDLFTSLASFGAASLHARGRTATRALLDELPDDPAAPVLEIGCGTGETAVRLGRRCPSVVAVDVSIPMLAAAIGRARWCAAGDVLHFVRVSAGGALPFRNAAFQAVVAESVLAVQRPEVLKRLVRECRRLVRPSGRVLINETVWRSTTPRNTADRLNRRSAASLGVIQATTDPYDADGWQTMFHDAGLMVVRRVRVDDLGPPARIRMTDRLAVFRSRSFTAWRRVRRLVTPTGRAERLRRAAAVRAIAPPRRSVEGVLFVLEPSTDAGDAAGRRG